MPFHDGPTSADLDACEYHPCKSQDSSDVSCTDIIGGQDSVLGRNCSCANPGLEYVESVGCRGRENLMISVAAGMHHEISVRGPAVRATRQNS
jgi:hypothetical protein